MTATTIKAAQLSETDAAIYEDMLDQLEAFVEKHALPLVIETRYNVEFGNSENSFRYKASGRLQLINRCMLPPRQAACASLMQQDTASMSVLQLAGELIAWDGASQESAEEIFRDAPSEGAVFLGFKDEKTTWA